MIRYEYDLSHKHFIMTKYDRLTCPACFDQIYNNAVTCTSCGMPHHSICFFYSAWSCRSCLLETD